MADIGEAMLTAPEMAALLTGPSLIQRMLDVEAALARAEANAGLIPSGASIAIAAQCRVELFDAAALYRDGAAAGTPVVPLVRELTALVDSDARRYVHLGATSQDIIDTAMVLLMREGLGVLTKGLSDIAQACAALADRYRHTAMAGRTLLQHAVPITFGLKAARWLAMVTRLLQRLRDLRPRVLVVQFGGAAGTLASLGRDGVRVADLLARELDLAVPDLPWHTERDRIGEAAGTLGVVAAAMGKVAGDIALLSQTEIDEVSTGAGAGRSSTMPQKRNPVEAMAAMACARLAIGLVPTILSAGVQEHERAAGAWQAEWQAVPDLLARTSGAVAWTRKAVLGLDVHAGRMKDNLEATDGLIMAEALTMALAPRLGRDEAYRIVGDVCEQVARSGASLRDVASGHSRIRAVLAPGELERVLDPAGYLGSADAFIDRALDAFRNLQG